MLKTVASSLTFDEFERRVLAEPDLELSWTYWNVIVAESAGLFVALLLIIALRRLMPLDFENIYTYHPPFGTQPTRYVLIREKAKELAKLIDAACPDSREKSVAQTNVQQAVMWANAAIAINEQDVT